jgi:hypothetical protein
MHVLLKWWLFESGGSHVDTKSYILIMNYAHPFIGEYGGTRSTLLYYYSRSTLNLTNEYRIKIFFSVLGWGETDSTWYVGN